MRVKKLSILLTIVVFQLATHSNLFAQSLTPERVRHIKECTFKITIEGSQSVGTGFFVGDSGTILTCWHVIEPAMVRDSKTNAIIGVRKIFIQLNSGQTLEVGILANLINHSYNDAVAYDFCILKVATLSHSPFPFLKIGNFNDLQEGDEVYTCGYPLGIQQQFISKGVASTKYLDTTIKIMNSTNGAIISMPRNQCLLDMTLNKGNSGGAVIKIGSNESDDEVIGIADFIINPIGGRAEALADFLKSRSGGVSISGVDPNLLFSNIVEILDNTSIGVSGCVSINHALDGFAKL
jgi:serine protease Do